MCIRDSHGIEERGVYRIQQFEKQEMIVVCKTEDSAMWFDKLWQNTVCLLYTSGPRYCPSSEDKIGRFSDKPRHQLFVEPMGLDTDEYYLQGMSLSLIHIFYLLHNFGKLGNNLVTFKSCKLS